MTGDPAGAEPAARPPRRRLDPLLPVLLTVAAGIALAALRRPQLGMFVVAAGLAAAAVLRLVLRPRVAASLVVRSRQVDVAVLVLLAAAVAGLAAVTPFPAGGR